MNTISNETLKEYYVKLQGMYENCYSLLSAINTSLQSNASEISVDVASADGTISTMKVPSFLYLENKLEQLDTNFSALFKMPESGQAWFTNENGMYKMNLVRSTTAPATPTLSTDAVFASITDNNFLKDLVSPKTFLRINIDGLVPTEKDLFMRKIVIYSSTLYDFLSGMNLSTYDEYHAALYNYVKGEDYDEYDSRIDIPLRKDTYRSAFNIDEIVEDPWVDPSNSNITKLTYKLKLSTLEYNDEEDLSIAFTLRPGDYVCLGNEMVIYKVKSIENDSSTVIIEETVGHIALQTTEENSSMVLKLYNENYGKYNYIDVPLEENQYICVFLGTIYNNVRSILSNGYLVDLGHIYMKDASGNEMFDSSGNRISYIDYYKKYCMNIGDLILALTKTTYPQLTNYNGQQLYDLQNSDTIKYGVNSTIDNETILQVVPINKHLTDDVTSEEIINLHAQKNNVQSQLETVRDNISQVYNTLVSTDFSQETSNTMAALQSQLQSYYSERTTLQNQLNSIIDNINAKSLDIKVMGAEVKYRIRGVTVVDDLIKVVQQMSDEKVNLISLDVEYKYKSTTKDTDSVTIINSSTFTDWNKQQNIERDRQIVFDTNVNSFVLDFVDYSSTENVIKWNQIDIPIKSGEDVVLRIRYKYNIGNPFINLYTPWSDELTINFPAQYQDDTDLTTIISTNNSDTVVAGFRKILMNEGYEEHISNKVVAADQVFFHQPENIYSGFTTSENSMISLKDKLLDMSQEIEQYKSWVEGEANSKFGVYLQYDEQNVALTPNNINKINIYNTDHITGCFIKKEMNIVIKNEGETRVNLYSIFPGKSDISLLKSDIMSYNQYIGAYERVPIFINNELAMQNLGQWIYFRQTNPYTREDIYLNTELQRSTDVDVAVETQSLPTHDLTWLSGSPTEYMMSKNQQVLHGYRDRTGVQYQYSSVFMKMNDLLSTMVDYVKVARQAGIIDSTPYDETLNSLESSLASKFNQFANYDGIFSDIYNKWEDEDFFYINSIWSTKSTASGKSNIYLMRYEDINGVNESTTQTVFLDDATSIINFLSKYNPSGFAQDSDFSGAFLFPSILSRESLTVTNGGSDHIFIDAGEQLSVPIVFEYFLDGTKIEDQGIDRTKVSKSIYFDIRNSLIKDPIHYMIEVIGNYDLSSSGDVYNNFSITDLEDNVTPED